MTAIKKYSYTDWWDGKICLIYATIVYNEKNKKYIPPRVSWDEIKQQDVPKIKKKQKDIFTKAVTTLLKGWKEDFAKRYKNSKATILLLNRELLKFEDIMYGPLPSYAPLLSYKEILIPIYSLSVIKNFITDTKVNGVALEFDFMHSPNYLFQNKKQVLAEIYAECCWRYVKWLELHLKQKKKQRKTLNSSSLKTNIKTVAPVENIPANKFPDIFTNGYAFTMFIELQKLTVTKKTIIADYGFIFHHMKGDLLKAIHSKLSHRNFIKFLNDNNYADLYVTKLPYKNPAKKQAILIDLSDKYKDNILKNPSINL